MTDPLPTFSRRPMDGFVMYVCPSGGGAYEVATLDDLRAAAEACGMRVVDPGECFGISRKAANARRDAELARDRACAERDAAIARAEKAERVIDWSKTERDAAIAQAKRYENERDAAITRAEKAEREESNWKKKAIDMLRHWRRAHTTLRKLRARLREHRSQAVTCTAEAWLERQKAEKADQERAEAIARAEKAERVIDWSKTERDAAIAQAKRYENERDAAIARAEKAERERDEAHHEFDVRGEKLCATEERLDCTEAYVEEVRPVIDAARKVAEACPTLTEHNTWTLVDDLREAFRVFDAAEADRIEGLTDEQVIAEAAAKGVDVEAEAEGTRAVLRQAIKRLRWNMAADAEAQAIQQSKDKQCKTCRHYCQHWCSKHGRDVDSVETCDDYTPARQTDDETEGDDTCLQNGKTDAVITVEQPSPKKSGTTATSGTGTPAPNATEMDAQNACPAAVGASAPSAKMCSQCRHLILKEGPFECKLGHQPCKPCDDWSADFVAAAEGVDVEAEAERTRGVLRQDKQCKTCRYYCKHWCVRRRDMDSVEVCDDYTPARQTDDETEGCDDDAAKNVDSDGCAMVSDSADSGSAVRGASMTLPAYLDREEMGRLVRERWVQWAKTQPNPKQHWLDSWESLNEPMREVDRLIGEAVALHVLERLRAQEPLTAKGARFIHVWRQKCDRLQLRAERCPPSEGTDCALAACKVFLDCLEAIAAGHTPALVLDDDTFDRVAYYQRCSAERPGAPSLLQIPGALEALNALAQRDLQVFPLGQILEVLREVWQLCEIPEKNYAKGFLRMWVMAALAELPEGLRKMVEASDD